MNAVGAAVVVIALLALISRLAPNSFPASHVTAAFLGGAQGRLSWPLNYWNGLGALVALGLPLLLSIASSARNLRTQVLSAAFVRDARAVVRHEGAGCRSNVETLKGVGWRG